MAFGIRYLRADGTGQDCARYNFRPQTARDTSPGNRRVVRQQPEAEDEHILHSGGLARCDAEELAARGIRDNSQP